MCKDKAMLQWVLSSHWLGPASKVNRGWLLWWGRRVPTLVIPNHIAMRPSVRPAPQPTSGHERRNSFGYPSVQPPVATADGILTNLARLILHQPESPLASNLQLSSHHNSKIVAAQQRTSVGQRISENRHISVPFDGQNICGAFYYRFYDSRPIADSKSLACATRGTLFNRQALQQAGFIFAPHSFHQQQPDYIWKRLARSFHLTLPHFRSRHNVDIQRATRA